MYYIMTGNPIKTYYDDFMESFKKQQKDYPDKKIIYSKNRLVEIVWDPKWKDIDCGNKKEFKTKTNSN